MKKSKAGSSGSSFSAIGENGINVDCYKQFKVPGERNNISIIIDKKASGKRSRHSRTVLLKPVKMFTFSLQE
jgi:hypothetical protein